MKHVSWPTLLVLAFAVACSDSPETPGAADAGVVPPTPDAAVAPAVIKILPLGDSLTLGFGSGEDGTGSEPGYRLRLWQRLADAGISVDFVGSQSNGPSQLPDKDHEGYNGYAVAQVGDMAGPALDAFAPDIILLLAGTNDQIEFVPPTQPPAGAAADFEQLLQDIHARQPGVHIIAGQVIPLTHNATGVEEYNALLPAIVDRQRTMGVNVRLVNHFAIGEGMLSTDGIHPTQAGYDAMADIWLPAVLAAIDEL